MTKVTKISPQPRSNCKVKEVNVVNGYTHGNDRWTVVVFVSGRGNVSDAKEVIKNQLKDIEGDYCVEN